MVRDIFRAFSRLYFEEAYLIGLSRTWMQRHVSDSSDQRFLARFSAHLQYYERHLFPELSEQLNKLTLLTAYHLQNHETLSARDCARVQAVHRAMGTRRGLSLSETIAGEAFETAARTYRRAFRSHLRFPRARKPAGTTQRSGFRNPVENFAEWQRQLYGLEVLPESLVLREALPLRGRLSSLPIERRYPNDRKFVFHLTSYFTALLGVDLGDVRIIQRPASLAPLMPVAAAVTFNRFRERPRRIALINFEMHMPPSRLLLLLFHEIFGHLLHVKTIDEQCPDVMKRLPYLSRFPLTEGFALLAEDFLLELLRKDRVRRNLGRILGPAFSPERAARAVEQHYYRLRLLRYARYLFERRVYGEQQNPIDVSRRLAQQLHLPQRELWTDLRSFLTTPGYASCYVGGYRILRRLGDYGDPAFRNAFGRAGFPFIGDLER